MSASIDHARYSLRLRERIGEEDTTREVVVVALRDGSGHVGYGEIAPLPGWHAETADDAVRVLPAIAHALGPDPIGRSGDLRRALESTPAASMPSVRFGIEMAWVALRAAVHGCTPADLASDAPAPTVEVSALFDGDLETAQRAAEDGVFENHGTVKIKVGRRSAEQERGILRTLTNRPGPTTRLRLDGNRRLELDQATALLDGIDPRRIEYFEEPMRDPRQHGLLFERTGVHIGLDETLRDPELGDVWQQPGVNTWILKPSLAGGWIGSMETAGAANARGISCVISSCFESGLGLWSLACLAAATQRPGTAAGLGTDRWLAEDTIEPPFDSSGGTVEIARWIAEPEPRRWEKATRGQAQVS